MIENEWIEKLKVGDKVIVNHCGFEDTMNVCVVDRITPKGFLSIAGNLYKRNGMSRGSSCSFISKADEENILEIEQRIVVNKCFKMIGKRRKITFEQAEKIIEILESVKE